MHPVGALQGSEYTVLSLAADNPGGAPWSSGISLGTLCLTHRDIAMVKVYDASNITEAHIVRGMLQANGIAAHVGGYYLQGAVGELAVQGFASVSVPAEQAGEARDLIAHYENGAQPS